MVRWAIVEPAPVESSHYIRVTHEAKAATEALDVALSHEQYPPNGQLSE
jgi:hypothetical protein